MPEWRLVNYVEGYHPRVPHLFPNPQTLVDETGKTWLLRQCILCDEIIVREEDE